MTKRTCRNCQKIRWARNVRKDSHTARTIFCKPCRRKKGLRDFEAIRHR